MNKRQAVTYLRHLLDVGADHNLGGTGEPVGLMVIYPGQAFLKAVEGGVNREDVVQALLDAMTDEASKCRN